MKRYEGKQAVIIGGTGVIGLAMAEMLVDGGARGLVTGQSQAGLDATQEQLGKGGIAASSDARFVDGLRLPCRRRARSRRRQGNP